MNAPNGALYPRAGDPPVLLPSPRSLRLTGARARLAPGAAPEVRRDAAAPAGLGAQGYWLAVVGEPRPRVVIEASSAAGERHARATLAQLVAQYGPDLPTLEIEDAPAIEDRGVMLDISRCRVPTMDELQRIVGLLASLKFNHLQLYTEHTFAYVGHEDIWRGADPMTPDEVRTLDGWCRDAGLTLAANQNCFGHLRRWLRHPRYAHLAETHGPFRFMEWDRLGPHSLCPQDPGSLRLIEDWLGQLLPCFSSGLVNLGCDETFDVGAGRSRGRAARIGAGRVRLEFVQRLCEAALRRGARPMVWGDMLAAHPEAAECVPREAVALMWGYEPETDFEALVDAARASAPERTCWVCPGTSSWLSIFGRGAERCKNVQRAARAAVSRRAGFMVCDWGDGGHRQQWPVTLRALGDAAEAAWCGAAHDSGGSLGLACPIAASLHLFGDAAARIVPALDELSACDAPLRAVCGGEREDGSRRPLKNASALYRDMHTALPEPFPSLGSGGGDAGGGGGAAVRGLSESDAWAQIRIPESGVREAARGLRPQLQREVELTLDTALLARERAVARRAGLSAALARDLAARMDDLIARARETWRARSREGGRDQSEGFDRRVREELRGAPGA